VTLVPAVADVMEAGRLAGEADRARDARDWAKAAELYHDSLDLDPRRADLCVQMGHALKEAGQLTKAEAAYRQAAEAMPDDADVRLQLGHALKLLGRTEDAVRAYSDALRLDPDLAPAREELVRLSARGALPGLMEGRAGAARELARLGVDIGRVMTTASQLSEQSIFPPEAHDAFRRRFPIAPPPGTPRLAVTVVIAAVGSSPAMLRATLISLLDQRHTGWSAVVVGADASLADHPVASLGLGDGRVCFSEASPAIESDAVLQLDAGTVLDPEALGWLAFGLERTGAGAIYADHDRYEPDWRQGLIRHSPAFQSMADPIDLATNPDPPTVVLSTVAAGTAAEALRIAMAAGPVAHLPRLLSSLPADQDPAAEVSPKVPATPRPGRIVVIIPTRDEAEMLTRAVRTLRDQAAEAGQIDFVILDNRSREAATAQALAALARESGVSVIPHDEPFNWSRGNNLGAAGGSQDILVFANNDIEMLTSGWDTRLRHWLGHDGTGIVGARLVYPDGGLQHGGILLGAWAGRPVHDGQTPPVEPDGPLGRWKRSRPVAAVTGAFLACTRQTFDAVGGFDERLAIAYNDIDFCLKTRRAGRSVVYAADIEAIHHESRTRGLNDNPEKVAWDDAELADLHARWGDALFHDPGYNPQWAAEMHRPYDGLRDLPLSRLLRHLDASAAARPWALPAAPEPGV
jgi:GT2 family glycosyltransferase